MTHDQVMAQAEQLLGETPAGEVPSVQAYDPDITGSPVVTDVRDIDQCSLQIGLPLFGRDDPDRFALRILNDVLGAGMSSRLFREVRERRGLAYSVHSGYGHLADAGSFTISAGVDRAKLAEAITICLSEAARLVDEDVPGEELRKAKDHAIGRFRLSLETASALGQRHGEALLTRGEIEPVEDYVAGLQAVTAADVKRVAGRIFQWKRLHCAVVGPGLNEDEVAKAMEAV